jgi:hypothetical protein
MSTLTSDILTSDFSLRAQQLMEDPLGGVMGSPDEAPAETFAQVISQLETSEPKSEGALAKKAREAAEEFVAISMVQPILAQLRQQPLVDPEDMGPLAPGRGEKMMQPLLDAQAAKGIVQAANWPMVERLSQQLLAKANALSGTPTTEIDRHA